MKKKILVAGGTGFLGFHLLKKLSHLNYTLFSLSSKKPTKHKKISKVKYIICDVTNPVLLKKKLKYNFDYIINFSGYIDHSNKSKTINSHYNGCKNLINLFKKKILKISFKLEVVWNMEILDHRIMKEALVSPKEIMA